MDLVSSESSLEQKLREFDLSHLDWGAREYTNYAIHSMDGNSLRELLIEDIKYRKAHGRNVVASIDGFQGTGKCEIKGSLVLMSDGNYKKIEDIKIGEKVVSLQYNGNITFEEVTEKSEWLCNDVYKVVSNRTKEVFYECSDNHLIPITLDFLTQGQGSHKKRKSSFCQLNVLMTPKEVIELQESQKVCRWQIKQGAYISSFENQTDCEINPYCLGVFLGDGCFCGSSLSICSESKELIGEIEKQEKTIRQVKKLKEGAKAIDYFFSINGGFGQSLTKLGLRGKKSGEKFIPKEALKSNAKYRALLLSGLIDTDGYVNPKGTITITTKSKQLAEDICFLTQSLGGNASINLITKKCQNNFVGDYFTINVNLGSYKNILTLQIKQKRERLFQEKGWHKQGLINFHVEKSVPQEVIGITITGKSKLYFTNKMVLTHNSLFMSSFAIIISKIFGVPFNADYVFYSPMELDFALEKAPKCATYLRDEHKNSSHGEMSNMINENLSDYEEQLRIDQINLLFAGVKLRSHAHFFIFEAKRTNFDLTGKPISTTAVLKTPLYTDKETFVWRGEITLPVPPMDYLNAYDQRKREYNQKQLKEKSENVFAQLKPYAEKVLNTREEDLIKKTREGFISPQKEEIIKLVVGEVIGSGKFTISAYRSIIAFIQDQLKKKYFKHNEDLIEELERKKQEQFEQRQALLDERRREDEERRKRKEELQKVKLEIEKERVKLKKQLYEMRKEGIADDQEEQESPHDILKDIVTIKEKDGDDNASS